MFSSTKIMQALSPAAAATGYQIARSLRFNSADTAYLTRTQSAGNRRTWHFKAWVKRSKLGTKQNIFGHIRTSPSNVQTYLSFLSGDTLEFFVYSGTTTIAQVTTTQVFRDVSAYMQIDLAVDTTQATASNRVKLFVNGTQITALSTATYMAQNYDTFLNEASQSVGIGRVAPYDTSEYSNFYLSDVQFIDGQALTPSDFGETDSATGVWVPKAYTGTYGTNGFWLKFDDNSGTTSTTLGKDSSGNGNNWTPNNFSVTAGAGNDSLVDSPTNYGTDTGAGGEVRGNYATLNPLAKFASTSQTPTLANGNLDISGVVSSNYSNAVSTLGVSSGKWYAEYTVGTLGTANGIGFVNAASLASVDGNYGIGAPSDGWLRVGTSVISNSASAVTGLSTIASNDIVMLAIDFDAGKAWWGRNGTWESSGNPATGANATVTFTPGGKTFLFGNAGYSASVAITGSVNYGQRPFAYTAPSGFKALCTQNLPTPTIGTSSTNLADDYFNVVTYTGTGSSLSITGVGFQPDLVWIKGRSGATDHALYDAVRGVQKQLESNTTTDETTESTGLTAFGTDGFTVGALAQLNTSAATYVGWNWKESATSGFDIVTYTGNGANRTIAHNLGVAPKMLIVKARTTAGTDTGWPVWHTGIANTNYLELNATTASTSGTTYWNSTSPTSSVFSVGTAAAVNTNNDTYVAYLFAEVTGFSKIGTYTGNANADGPFVYCGFRPKFVMSKNASSGVQGWTIQNPANQNYNEINNYVFAQSANAETGTFAKIDFLSNGFKIRTSDPLVNGDTNNIIFIAFAENPFNYSRAR